MRQNKKPFGNGADMIPVNNVSAHRFLKSRQTPKMSGRAGPGRVGSDPGARARGSGSSLGITQWMM